MRLLKVLMPVLISTLLIAPAISFSEEETPNKKNKKIELILPVKDFLDGKVVEKKDLIDSNLDYTYITGGGGLNLVEDSSDFHDKFNDHFYEAQINYHLNWWDNISDDSLLYNQNHKLSLKLTAKFLIRQVGEDSNPVKTPGYLPRLTLFYWYEDNLRNKPKENNSDGGRVGGGSSAKEKPGSSESFTYGSLRISHHSNGQTGDFYNEDSTVNTDTGNFSTDFLELSGYHIGKYKYWPSWSRLSLIWHQTWITREALLKDQYEILKVRLSLRTKERNLYDDIFGSVCDVFDDDDDDEWKITRIMKKLRWKGSLSMSYIPVGREYIRAPNEDFPDIDVKRATEFDKMHFSSELHIKPHIWENVSFFFKYDLGYDYYNIHFQERIHRIQFGISGDQFNYFR